MSDIRGKAIYSPSGRANEYSYSACNFYKGCSGGCTYCFLKKGILAKTLGGDTPKLKASFKDEYHGLEIFRKELDANIDHLRKHGLFFSFSTDPMLLKTIGLTLMCVDYCLINEVPVKILTKQSWWINNILQFKFENRSKDYRKFIAFGFTLTGHDELEPGCAPNSERVEAMKILYNEGFITWASIEPVIDFHSSYKMIIKALNYCSHFKIGLESGKEYSADETGNFMHEVNELIALNSTGTFRSTIYWKDSLLKKAGIKRESLPSFCVPRSYNIFTG